MNKPTLYILCGLPFAGKTVLTQKLIERLGFAQVSIDEIKFAHGYEWADDEHVPDEEWKKIFAESYQKSLELLASGKSVIYDCANQDRASRDRLRNVAAKGNFPTEVILVDVTPELARERWLKNKEAKERFDLPGTVFQQAINTYERPTSDENVIVFEQSSDLDDWISKNFL